MRSILITGAVLTLCATAPAAAQVAKKQPPINHDSMHAIHHATDSAFAALQARGRLAMGVDQYTSTHRFDALPDGGRIELQRNEDDPDGVAAIRAHLQDIVDLFRNGDFDTPFFVHDGEVPGTRVMAEKKAVIAYIFEALPRGGQVRIRTKDAAAIAAIHEFMAFQRMDHRAEGRH